MDRSAHDNRFEMLRLDNLGRIRFVQRDKVGTRMDMDVIGEHKENDQMFHTCALRYPRTVCVHLFHKGWRRLKGERRGVAPENGRDGTFILFGPKNGVSDGKPHVHSGGDTNYVDEKAIGNVDGIRPKRNSRTRNT